MSKLSAFIDGALSGLVIGSLIVFGFIMSAIFLAWVTILPSIGVLWVLGWLK